MNQISEEKPMIWFLDDEEDILEIMSEVATQKGYLVGAKLSSLKDAWQILKNTTESHEIPDFIISDYHLQDGESEPWLYAVRQSFPTTKVICLSGKPELDFVKRLRTQGIEFCEKPMSLAALFKVLTV